MVVFIDCEFTDLVHPELLSLGMVTLDGREHYVELDLATDIGKARRKASSDFVKYDGVLDMWGLVPGAACTEWEMGRRTGEWLLSLAGESRNSSPGSLESLGRIEVAFDYSTDYELMEYVIRDSGLWDRVREVVVPMNVGALTGSPEGEDAAEACFREQHRRHLARHHALADACALRAAYIAVKAVAREMASKTSRRSDFVHSPDLRRLLLAASGGQAIAPEKEGYLRAWLVTKSFALEGRLPIDVLDEPGGLELVEAVLLRLAYNVNS
jgi:hypothetical protein